VTVLDSCCTDSLKTCRGSLFSSLAASAERVGCSVCAGQSTGIIATERTTHPSKGRRIDILILLPHLNWCDEGRISHTPSDELPDAKSRGSIDFFQLFPTVPEYLNSRPNGLANMGLGVSATARFGMKPKPIPIDGQFCSDREKPRD